jgi:EAL domain-containing protein (putative c-di-GMP-specific phosphodiesterase class I)
MGTECALCTFQKDCADGSVFLYAAAPLLRDIVSAHLRDLGAIFRLEDELFGISGDQDQVFRDLRARLSEAECADIRVTRSRGSAVMVAPTLDQWDRQLDTSWFDRALQEDAFTSFFQPIVDTQYGRIFAYECLIRLFGDRPYNGGEIIEAALSRGRIHLFDAYARKLSIRKAALKRQANTKLFINFMPSSIYDPAYCMRSTLEEMEKTALRPADIVFEVVESETITDSKHLKKICDYYRRENFGFALDDVGAGSNSFQMICDLQPDYIKLDKSLISKIEDPMYYAAVGKLSEFAGQFGLKVIAEGIEDAQTAEKLQNLGIYLMQGYYFGRPGPDMLPSDTDLLRLSSRVGASNSRLAAEAIPNPGKPYAHQTNNEASID